MGLHNTLPHYSDDYHTRASPEILSEILSTQLGVISGELQTFCAGTAQQLNMWLKKLWYCFQADQNGAGACAGTKVVTCEPPEFIIEHFIPHVTVLSGCTC